MLDKRRGGSFIGHGGEREIKREKENENNEERLGEELSRKGKEPPRYFKRQPPFSHFLALALLHHPPLFTLPSFTIQERARRFSAKWMERFANGLSSGQTVECHGGEEKKERHGGVGGELCEVTRAHGTGTG